MYLSLSRLLNLEEDLLPVLALRQCLHDFVDPLRRLRIALLRWDNHDLVVGLLQLYMHSSKLECSTNGEVSRTFISASLFMSASRSCLLCCWYHRLCQNP